jgi:hypothetical protein
LHNRGVFSLCDAGDGCTVGPTNAGQFSDILINNNDGDALEGKGPPMAVRRYPLLTRMAAMIFLLATMLAAPLAAGAAPSIGIGKPTATPDTGNSTSTDSGDDASVFASYLKQESKSTILYGPASGDLVHDPEKITTDAANLDVADFIAHAEFGNPYAATGGAAFDFGILFRLGQSPHLRVIVTSDGGWFLTPGADASIAKGTVKGVNAKAGGTNSIDLVVVGNDGYLGINGKFVTKLDVSKVTGKGDVAVGTAFFDSNFKDGASTTYKNFTVWSVKKGATTTTGGKTPTTEASPAASPVANNGEGYVSPQFGYTIAYDSTWSIDPNSPATSDDQGDYVRLTNGVSTVDFAGFNSTATPQECLKDEVDYFTGAPGYTKVKIAQDTDGKDMTGAIAGGAYEVLTFTYASGEDKPVDYAAYVECRTIQKGVSILRIDQYVEASKYNDQIDPVTALLKGLKIEGQSTSDVTPTEESTAATPTEETTTEATPTTESGNSTTTTTGAVNFRLDSDGSPVGLVRITADKDAAKSDVKISASDLPEGSIALIHKGTCDSFTADPAYYLNDFDADGNSTTVVKASLDKLTTGGYVVVVHESLDDLTKAYACGAIAS